MIARSVSSCCVPRGCRERCNAEAPMTNSQTLPSRNQCAQALLQSVGTPVLAALTSFAALPLTLRTLGSDSIGASTPVWVVVFSFFVLHWIVDGLVFSAFHKLRTAARVHFENVTSRVRTSLLMPGRDQRRTAKPSRRCSLQRPTLRITDW